MAARHLERLLELRDVGDTIEDHRAARQLHRRLLAFRVGAGCRSNDDVLENPQPVLVLVVAEADARAGHPAAGKSHRSRGPDDAFGFDV
jgi:hypothetical protein